MATTYCEWDGVIAFGEIQAGLLADAVFSLSRLIPSLDHNDVKEWKIICNFSTFL